MFQLHLGFQFRKKLNVMSLKKDVFISTQKITHKISKLIFHMTNHFQVNVMSFKREREWTEKVHRRIIIRRGGSWVTGGGGGKGGGGLQMSVPLA